MEPLRRLVVIIALLLPSMANAAEEPIVLDSGDRQNRLLELFTSEGCSSCPPADEFLSELQTKDTLWNPWVPVAFHVGYWDYLGWKDVFAKPENQIRQRAYRQADRSNGVYTPGFFINGQEWRGFFNWNRSLPEYSQPPAGRISANISNGKVRASFTPITTDTTKKPVKYLLHWSLTGSDRSTQVRSGENARSTLHHDFVALEYDQVEDQLSTDGIQWQFNIPANQHEGPLALSLWVTPQQDHFEVLQATGGWIQ